MPFTPDEVVGRIRRAAAAAPDADKALLAAIEIIALECGIPYGEIWRTYSGSTVLYLKDAWHRPGHDFVAFEAESRKIALASGVGLSGRVWQAREPVVLADLRAAPAFSRQAIALKTGFRSALGVPVFDGDELCAVLVFMMFDRRLDLPGLVGTLAGAVGPALAPHLSGAASDAAPPRDMLVA